MKSPRGRTTRQQAAPIRDIAASILEDVRQGMTRSLPVVAYYGTQRLWRQKKDMGLKRGVKESRLDGYTDCLDPASNHKHLHLWMRRRAFARNSDQFESPHVKSIEQAVLRCINGARHFFYDTIGDEIQIEWKDGKLIPFDLLSDGYRNMVAMVADIAWRSVVLNPHWREDAPQRTEGVVLVDEIDLHLHPNWQSRVAHDLMRAFPNIQVIATTHSPQVVATMKKEWMIILDGGKARSSGYVEGRDSNAILADVMGSDERPEEMKRRLDKLFRHIDEKAHKTARQEIEILSKLLGADDPELVRARWLLHGEEGN